MSTSSHGTLVVVKLYYPNQWRKNVGDLASKQDKRFNWFLCSKRYESEIPGFYVAEIAKGTRFYDSIASINYILPEPAKLLIVTSDQGSTTSSTAPGPLDQGWKTFEKSSFKWTKLNYKGLASTVECENPSGSIICPEATFGFIQGCLKVDKNIPNECPIIRYAKANYKCIRAKIPKFPTSSDIDRMLDDGYSLSDVCKILYEDIIEYTSRV
jgi:hypothetical protein